MTAVFTMMVRDEADVIAATLEHHLAQGIDTIIVTDNGSVDGTREVLREYEAVAPVIVFDDPEHRKQQGEVVTRMARLAHDRFGADWVVNGDADEFLVPLDSKLTLREVFERMPVELGAFTAPVVNLAGPMARRGSGIRRLVHRDVRSQAQLRSVGLLSHPTPNAIHVGSADVDVSQGNHFTSIEQRGEVPPELALEVLHLPWRSVAQLARKTENMGRGYEASPDLRPSPRHHGMRDWRRLKGGVLEAFLALRSPTETELAGEGFVADSRLRERLEQLVEHARIPERLRECLDDSNDEVLPADAVERMRVIARAIRDAEEPLYEELTGLRMHADGLERLREELVAERDAIISERELAQLAVVRLQFAEMAAELARLQAEHTAAGERLAMFERHPLVRAMRAMRAMQGRLRRRHRGPLATRRGR